MTNRQLACKMVAKGLNDLKQQIKEATVKSIAETGGKKHTTAGAADKVRDVACKLIDPWIVRMEKLMTPKAEKVTKEPAEAS
jgi:hypothetical protein